ncbi:MAG: hypothetical protein RDV48_21995 [Candidatus Eremiobacteraeota bacterium]|nr:hypothetical protein [Candidatus Eremiobacteraeota bacterium]
MKVTVTAPARIDLAGGTLDIFPLYIFEGGGMTVNMAIDMVSMAQVETVGGREIIIKSLDLGEEARAESLEELAPSGVLELVMRAVKFCAPREGLHISIKNMAPKGSGLGASSSLLVALMWALQGAARERLDPAVLIDWCANVEAQSLGIPTGKQDYYAAFYGGFSAIHFNERAIRREGLSLSAPFLEALKESLVLSFTGISHFSGATNWDMMKGYIDNAGGTREKMKHIGRTAVKMRESLINEDMDALASALAEEWDNRKHLAEGVSNKKIDAMVEAAAREGAMASKICGAGGGGCMVTLAPPSRRARVMKALEEAGAAILDFSPAGGGVRAVEG